MAVLENVEPKRVFHYFEEICSIPHGSGNTKAISDYLVNFAKDHNLKCIQDANNNIIIKKQSSKGYENAPGVILQGHMDMVCEKEPSLDFDFTKDGLRLGIDGDFIHANGTTLGGDDGIAVAMSLAILENDEILHPEIEVIVTVDEEIGLLGANSIDCSSITGKRFINIDSEEEGALWVGCAGGLQANSYIPVDRVEITGEEVSIKITGLVGGHSGAEIDKNRSSANLLMGRVLYAIDQEIEFDLVSLAGGTKDNAITRDAEAHLIVNKNDINRISDILSGLQKDLRKEYTNVDEGITLICEDLGNNTVKALTKVSKEKIIFYLRMVPFGVKKMSAVMPGLVETSSNVGIVKLEEDKFTAISSVRSSYCSARDALSSNIQYLTEFLGGDFDTVGAYPAWEYRQESPLRDKMVEVYERMYGTKPECKAIHAGLECGLFYDKINDLDCISLGPDMQDIHTSREKLSISSTKRVWEYLVEVLKELK